MDDAWLLEKIVETTKDKKSFRFWLKAIKELGPGIVNEELGELLHQMRLGKVNSHTTRKERKRKTPTTF